MSVLLNAADDSIRNQYKNVDNLYALGVWTSHINYPHNCLVIEMPNDVVSKLKVKADRERKFVLKLKCNNYHWKKIKELIGMHIADQIKIHGNFEASFYNDLGFNKTPIHVKAKSIEEFFVQNDLTF